MVRKCNFIIYHQVLLCLFNAWCISGNKANCAINKLTTLVPLVSGCVTAVPTGATTPVVVPLTNEIPPELPPFFPSPPSFYIKYKTAAFNTNMY